MVSHAAIWNVKRSYDIVFIWKIELKTDLAYGCNFWNNDDCKRFITGNLAAQPNTKKMNQQKEKTSGKLKSYLSF